MHFIQTADKIRLISRLFKLNMQFVQTAVNPLYCAAKQNCDIRESVQYVIYN